MIYDGEHLIGVTDLLSKANIYTLAKHDLMSISIKQDRNITSITYNVLMIYNHKNTLSKSTLLSFQKKNWLIRYLKSKKM